jgi:hypothetical protein
MIISSARRSFAACLLALAVPCAPAADGLGFSFGDGPQLQLVRREAGSPPNEQPVALSAEAVGRLLGKVRLQTDAGDEALFAPAEIEQMQGRLAQLLAQATPEQDLLLASAYRRGMAGALSPRTAIGARLFIKGGQLQLIVHDARLPVTSALGAGTTPSLTFGSRSAAGTVHLLVPGAQQPRPDWVALSLADAAAPPAAAQAPAAARSPAAASAEERLTTLKQLHEKGLITNEEYQQKRREILQAL